MQTKPNRQKPKKSRWGIVIFLIMSIAIAVSLYLIYPKKIAPEAPEYPKTLFNIDDVKSIDISLDGQNSYSIINKDNILYLNGETPLNADKSELIYRIITNIIAEEKINSDNLSMDEIGLNNPHLIVSIERSNGQNLSLSIGEKAPLSDNFYCKISGDTQLYAVNNGYEDIFNIDPKFLIDSESTGIYRNLIKSISIRNKNGIFDISLRDTASKRTLAYITEPINYPADSDKINVIVNELLNIDLTLVLDDYNSQSEYGFDSNTAVHIDVEQYAGEGKDISLEESTKEITLGNSDEFYIYALYNNKVYRISSLAMQSIINCDLDSLVSKKIFNLSARELDNLVNIKDTMNGNTTLYSILKDSSGEMIVYKDNEPFDTDAFVDSIKKLFTLELDGLSGETNISNTKLLRSIELAQQNATHTISFYEKDIYNVFVDIDGVSVGYCIKQKLNQMLLVD